MEYKTLTFSVGNRNGLQTIIANSNTNIIPVNTDLIDTIENDVDNFDNIYRGFNFSRLDKVEKITTYNEKVHNSDVEYLTISKAINKLNNAAYYLIYDISREVFFIATNINQVDAEFDKVIFNYSGTIIELDNYKLKDSVIDDIKNKYENSDDKIDVTLDSKVVFIGSYYGNSINSNAYTELMFNDLNVGNTTKYLPNSFLFIKDFDTILEPKDNNRKLYGKCILSGEVEPVSGLDKISNIMINVS